MKKIIIQFSLLLVSFVGILQIANAATCNLWTQEWINGSWTVPSDCTLDVWPHLINWNVTVWDRIVTIPNNSMLVLDLSLRKATFNLWKILLQWNALIKYLWSSSYTSTSWSTACPVWTLAVAQSSLADAVASLVNANNAMTAWRFYCR
mgnify:CR=1